MILLERQPLTCLENRYQQAAAKDDGCGDDNEEKYLNMKIEKEIKMKVKMMMEMSQGESVFMYMEQTK